MKQVIKVTDVQPSILPDLLFNAAIRLLCPNLAHQMASFMANWHCAVYWAKIEEFFTSSTFGFTQLIWQWWKCLCFSKFIAKLLKAQDKYPGYLQCIFFNYFCPYMITMRQSLKENLGLVNINYWSYCWLAVSKKWTQGDNVMLKSEGLKIIKNKIKINT